MELSGHSPFIVFDDVDLNKVTDMAITAKFRNSIREMFVKELIC